MMEESEFFAKCLSIGRRNYLNIPYKNLPIQKMYEVDGIANSATHICHYCNKETLEKIADNKCLRFTDIAYLNDFTEFSDAISILKCLIENENYPEDFKRFINNSGAISELEDYTQAYSYKTHILSDGKSLPIKYCTYTCSFSMSQDSLMMWNYYGSSTSGVSVCFSHVWKMFEDINDTNVNSGRVLSNNIGIFHGRIIYNNDEKITVVSALLNDIYELYIDKKEELEKYETHIIKAFKESFNQMRSFFKNSSFKDEREYRVMLKIPESILKDEQNSLSIVRKGINEANKKPYIDYKINLNSIVTIVLNPYARNESSDENILEIKELFKRNFIDDIKVVYSNIPIR